MSTIGLRGSLTRSVRRALAEVLPAYTLLVVREPVADDQRPAGLIDVSVAQVASPRAEQTQVLLGACAMTITLWPPVPTDFDVEVAATDADTVCEQVLDLLILGRGAGPYFNGAGRRQSGPQRMAIFDYRQATLHGDTRAGGLNAVGVMELGPVAGQVLTDPTDPARFTVVVQANARVQLAGLLPAGQDPSDPGELVDSFPGRFVP